MLAETDHHKDIKVGQYGVSCEKNKVVNDELTVPNPSCRASFPTFLLHSAETWMSDKEAEQRAQPAHETPVFRSSEVEPALKALKTLVAKLSKKPAPKKEKPAKADNSTEEAVTGEEGDEATPEGEGDGDGGGGAEEGSIAGEGEKEGVGEGTDGDTEADASREDEL